MERKIMMVPTVPSFVLQMPQSSTGNRSLTWKKDTARVSLTSLHLMRSLLSYKLYSNCMIVTQYPSATPPTV